MTPNGREDWLLAPRERRRGGITDRSNWPRYALGLLTEALYILGLTLLAYLIALVALALKAGQLL